MDLTTSAVYIADYDNDRVLEFNETVNATTAPANVTANMVFGQNGSFTTGGCGGNGATGPKALCSPYGMWVDSSSNLYVADDSYNRALEFFTPVSSVNTTADVVWGQGGNFFSTYGNLGGSQPSAQTLYSPVGIVVDPAGNLLIGDYSNNRVLEFEPPFDAPALEVRAAAASASTGSLQVTPAKLSFKTTAVGHQSNAQNLTITNTSSVPVTIGQIVITNDFVTSPGCNGALPAGVSCTLHVSFKPVTGGRRGGKLVLSDDAGNSPQVVPLSGAASGAK